MKSPSKSSRHKDQAQVLALGLESSTLILLKSSLISCRRL